MSGPNAVEQGPRLAPFSREDLGILKGTLGQRAPLRDCLEAGIHDRGMAGTYAFAVDASRRVFMEDCLIDAGDIRKLRKTRMVDAFRPFPLSRFMVLLRQHTAILRAMPVASAEDRRELYVVIMVLALRSPHLLQFLPSARGSASSSTPRGPSTRRCRRCSGGAARSAGTAGSSWCARPGFDLETQSFSRPVLRRPPRARRPERGPLDGDGRRPDHRPGPL